MESYGYLHLPIENEAYVLAASRTGLHILGQNEEALAAPVEILREVYGPRIETEPPRVRLIGDVQVQEPIMHVRISMEARFREAVERAMKRRGATPAEAYSRPSHCVLRYEAPLAVLLGLTAELAEIAGGRAKHWTALSHYAIVTGGPGGHAA